MKGTKVKGKVKGKGKRGRRRKTEHRADWLGISTRRPVQSSGPVEMVTTVDGRMTHRASTPDPGLTIEAVLLMGSAVSVHM